MPTFYASLPPELQRWALAQPVFFTATAPSFGSHINVSPKGHTSASFAVLSPNSCAYLDATGSGCETAAHLRDNGRITLMWLSFGASPRIMRLFGTGRVIERGGTGDKGCREFEDAVQRMRLANGGNLDNLPVQKGKGNEGDKGWRGVVEVRFFKVQTSCGWGVPLMTGLPPPPPRDEKKGGAEAQGQAQHAVAGDTRSPVRTAIASVKAELPKNTSSSEPPSSLDDIRSTVAASAADEASSIANNQSAYRGPPYQARVTLANFMAVMSKKDGQPGMEYQAKNNATSLDGLPGYQSARRSRLTRGRLRDRVRNGGELVVVRGQVLGRRLWGEREGFLVGWILGLLMGLILAIGARGVGELMGSAWDEASEWARR
jgi:hypothetical protein